MAEASASNNNSLIEDFSSHLGLVSQVFQSKTSRELLSNLASALKRLFKVKSVNFILQCTEAIDTLRKEGACMKLQTHCHNNYYVIVPETEDKN